MEPELNGKVALVTGENRDLGVASAGERAEKTMQSASRLGGASGFRR
jgi:hypothetical protein